MKRNITIAFLAVLLLIAVLSLARLLWQCALWRIEATTNAEFAAALWADNDYNKGKIVKLRLVIEAEPKGYVDKPPECDGPYVVREQFGYSDPRLGGSNSPSIQVARLIVDTYNKQMTSKVENPEKYKAERLDEIEYWRENILNKKGMSDKSTNRTGKTRP